VFTVLEPRVGSWCFSYHSQGKEVLSATSDDLRTFNSVEIEFRRQEHLPLNCRSSRPLVTSPLSAGDISYTFPNSKTIGSYLPDRSVQCCCRYLDRRLVIWQVQRADLAQARMKKLHTPFAKGLWSLSEQEPLPMMAWQQVDVIDDTQHWNHRSRISCYRIVPHDVI
jgi:hypothetical protein